VNVALINRYFVSKEGLFEACMMRTADELDSQNARRSKSIEEGIARLVSHVVNAPDSDDPLQMLLMLRSSGDDNADLIRRRTLEHFTRRLAEAAGWKIDDDTTATILLRAQLRVKIELAQTLRKQNKQNEKINCMKFMWSIFTSLHQTVELTH
jgi:AcrR family transcriptional regulator